MLHQFILNNFFIYIRSMIPEVGGGGIRILLVVHTIRGTAWKMMYGVKSSRIAKI